MKKQQWMKAGLLAVLVGVIGGTGQAWGQPAPVILAVKSDFSYGDADDIVVASVVETGARTGASQIVTLQLLNTAGSVVAQTTGSVDQETPLRLVYRTPTATPVFARAIATVGVATLSVPVITVERWPATDPASYNLVVNCYFEMAMPRPPPPPPGPITLKCEPIDPPPPPPPPPTH